MRSHPMRNYVECCLGGDVPLPEMSVTARNKLEPGDVLLVCTDGLWSGVEDGDLAARRATSARRSTTAYALSPSARLRRTRRTATTRASRPCVGTALSTQPTPAAPAGKLLSDTSPRTETACGRADDAATKCARCG